MKNKTFKGKVVCTILKAIAMVAEIEKGMNQRLYFEAAESTKLNLVLYKDWIAEMPFNIGLYYNFIHTRSVALCCIGSFSMTKLPSTKLI